MDTASLFLGSGGLARADPFCAHRCTGCTETRAWPWQWASEVGDSIGSGIAACRGRNHGHPLLRPRMLRGMR